MKPDAYQRNLAARAFDVARYLLFWGVPTNVGQVASIRTLEKQIRRLKASEYDELREPGRGNRAGLRRAARLRLGRQCQPEPLAPTLARHADADRHAAQSREDLKLWAAQNLPARAGNEADRVDLMRPTNVPADIAATLLYPVTDRPFRELYELACSVERAAARRGDRRGAAIAHAARRDPRRLPRGAVRLRHGDRYRRLPRSAPPSPLPEIPPGV